MTQLWTIKKQKKNKYSLWKLKIFLTEVRLSHFCSLEYSSVVCRRALATFHIMCKLSTIFQNLCVKTQTSNQYIGDWQSVYQKDEVFSPLIGVSSGTQILQNVWCLTWLAKLAHSIDNGKHPWLVQDIWAWKWE